MTTFSTLEDFRQPKFQFYKQVGYFKALWLLTDTYQLTCPWKGQIHRFTIPAGYLTDKASVPWVAWTLGFTRDGQCEAAALLHDPLYTFSGQLPKPLHQILNKETGEWETAPPLTRKECDELYGYVCRLGGMSKVKAGICVAALRADPLLWNKFKAKPPDAIELVPF